MRIFEEKQKFNQWWIWLIHFISLGAFAFMIYALYQQNTSSEERMVLMICAMVLLLSTLFLHSIKLETQIDEHGVQYRMFPFHRAFKQLRWGELNEIYTRKYSPIKEFGGWGYRIGWKGKALNISGNQGIQLVWKGGNKLLIGTQKPEEAQRIINKYFTDERV